MMNYVIYDKKSGQVLSAGFNKPEVVLLKAKTSPNVQVLPISRRLRLIGKPLEKFVVYNGTLQRRPDWALKISKVLREKEDISIMLSSVSYRVSEYLMSKAVRELLEMGRIARDEVLRNPRLRKYLSEGGA